MAAPIPRPVGIINFASALCGALFLVFLVISGGRPTTAFASAADCLTAPNSAAPADSHWYFRTDRAQQRKCWFLRSGGPTAAHSAATVASETPADKDAPPSAAPNSLASFKAFITQQRGTAPPDRDVEKLYAEFLAWNRRVKN